MKFLFRWHRGSLAESMETVKEFEDVKQFKSYLTEELSHYGKKPGKLNVQYCGYDSRINWHTWYVTEDGQTFGMVNANLEQEFND